MLLTVFYAYCYLGRLS